MPQTSPMNWMIISFSMIILMNSLLNMMKTNKMIFLSKTKKMKNKSILWKW